MKKLILVLVVLFAVFVIVERHKLFLRDPLAKVTLDGQQISDTRVYINIDNDVMVEHTVEPVLLVVAQHEQHLGLPQFLHCLRWTACLTDAYPATLVTPGKGPIVQMSSKVVEWKSDAGKDVVVTLR